MKKILSTFILSLLVKSTMCVASTIELEESVKGPQKCIDVYSGEECDIPAPFSHTLLNLNVSNVKVALKSLQEDSNTEIYLTERRLWKLNLDNPLLENKYNPSEILKILERENLKIIRGTGRGGNFYPGLDYLHYSIFTTQTTSGSEGMEEDVSALLFKKVN